MKPVKPLFYPETIPPFNRWINELREGALNPRRYGFSFTDIDGVFFRLSRDDSEIVVAMLEVKSHGKKSSQTVSVVNQKLFSVLNAVMSVCDGKTFHYTLHGERVSSYFRYLGMHVLKMSNTRPDDSEWMTWDGYFIDTDTLVRILRLEIEPRYPFNILEEAA